MAGKLRLTVGSGVFIVGGDDGVHSRLYPCYYNIAWQLYRNPQITLVKADRKDDAIDTDAATERDHFAILGDHLGETLQAGTWQKGIAPSARGLLFDAYGNAWEQLVKCGVTDRYMKQGGDENRQMALKLLEGSAKEGFGFARQKVAAS